MTMQDTGEQNLEQTNENDQALIKKRELLNALSANIYQLYEVQKYLYNDVKKFSEASGEFITVTKTFKGSVEDFSLLAPELRRQIRYIIENSVTETLKRNETELGKMLVATASVETNKLVQSLNTSVRNAESTLDSYVRYTKLSQWKMIGIAVLCGLTTFSLGAALLFLFL